MSRPQHLSNIYKLPLKFTKNIVLNSKYKTLKISTFYGCSQGEAHILSKTSNLGITIFSFDIILLSNIIIGTVTFSCFNNSLFISFTLLFNM